MPSSARSTGRMWAPGHSSLAMTSGCRASRWSKSRPRASRQRRPRPRPPPRRATLRRATRPIRSRPCPAQHGGVGAACVGVNHAAPWGAGAREQSLVPPPIVWGSPVKAWALGIAGWLLMAPLATADSPAQAVISAYKDASAHATDARQLSWRYLWLGAVPAAKRDSFTKALAYAVNSLSQESEPVSLVLVAPDVVRVAGLDLSDAFIKTWDKLAAFDIYFHAQVLKDIVEVKEREQEQVTEDVEVGYWRLNSSNIIVSNDYAKRHPDNVWWQKTGVEKRTVTREKKTDAKSVKQQVIATTAPWLPAKEMGDLIKLLGTEVPIVRADWWLVWTAV